ncbi:ribosome maturation factor RimM [Chitinimonas sp. PSY-7]|uniref:ribosome maturation factor RimM n=1 Tax=Chitinimonas sp. PSY-7 TaxID=3459088 RepID=UPI00403FEE50
MKPAKQQPIAASAAGIPADLVPMGFIAGAFGIRGWVKVVSDTEYVDSLFEYPVWWLGRNGQWRAYKVLNSSAQPKNINAQLEGVDDRDVAAALKGTTVAVPRSEMPETDEDEFYWADLIGSEVINRQEERLGIVQSLLATGANDVLVVRDGDTERLVPFVGAVVDSVDQTSRVIRVDWGLDY